MAVTREILGMVLGINSKALHITGHENGIVTYWLYTSTSDAENDVRTTRTYRLGW